jgi:site-specific DNA recombinase
MTSEVRKVQEAKTMMRVVGYPRVSTEEQAREGISLASQRAKIAGYASLYDLELIDVIEDAGVSAKTLDRPGLQKVLALLDSGQAEGVVLTKLDRLTRSLRDWSYLIDHYFGEKGGRKLFSVGDSIDTRTATGRMMLNMVMTIAQWEREIISERTCGALQHKIKMGERCGKVRYGHVLASDGRMLADNPSEQETIRLMWSLRCEGRSFRQIADALKARGIETKEGNSTWMPSTIRRILARSA